MRELLQRFLESGEQICLYTERDAPGGFAYGRLLAVSGPHFALYLVSPDGAFDGVLVEGIDRVLRVEAGGLYQEKMERLCRFASLPPFPQALEGDLVAAVLAAARKMGKIVSVEVDESGEDDFAGFVAEPQNGLCRFLRVDEYGMEDGEAFVRPADVTRVVCASGDEERRLRLWQARREG